MKFKVHTGQIGTKREGFYLMVDNWDDWFQFSTMYYLRYVNSKGRVHDIGSVKIGQYSMNTDQRRPSIPDTFEALGEIFFSIGQSEDYYENIKKLGDKYREFILEGLNDIAYRPEIYEKCRNENVTKTSLMRDVTEKTILNQFNRMAHGGARLTKYSFGYSFPTIIKGSKTDIVVDDPAKLTFVVKPESNPPTNIHIVIGRNGVGKTFLIKNLIGAISKSKNEDEVGHFFDPRYGVDDKISADELFANAICVGFSAFDDLPTSLDQIDEISIPYVFIGLDNNDEKTSLSRIDKLSSQFAASLHRSFSSKSKRSLWRKAMDVLNYDNYFQESRISETRYIADSEAFENNAKRKFAPLSSGHKIILLIITRLVEVVEEKSLIILDEPETHLHPPLLAAFIRALSDILTTKNGVAFITTHSPVILQEVPSSCVWKMQRSKIVVSLENLQQETFGTNINSLIREVFGLEVEKSGFHQLLAENLKKQNYNIEDVIWDFNDELGDEAKAILRVLAALRSEEE